MGLLDELSKRLSKLKTSSELADVIPDLEAQLLAAEASEFDLEKQLSNALFDSPASAKGISEKIAANQEEQRTLRAAVAGAERKRELAHKAEQTAVIENKLRQAKQAQSSVREQYIELHKHLSEVERLVEAIIQGEFLIKEANDLAISTKLTDVRVAQPASMLDALIGVNRPLAQMEQHPSTYRIPGYRPKSAHGPALARMSEVVL